MCRLCLVAPKRVHKAGFHPTAVFGALGAAAGVASALHLNIKQWVNALGIAGSMPAYEAFTLGGPLRLSGYRINEFSGREYVFGRLMYYHRIFALPDILGSGVYVGGSAEVGQITNRFDNLPSPGTLWSGSAFLGADTFLGPAYLGFGFGGGGNWSIYLLLGVP